MSSPAHPDDLADFAPSERILEEIRGS